jgi:hypothetical protein
MHGDIIPFSSILKQCHDIGKSEPELKSMPDRWKTAELVQLVSIGSQSFISLRDAHKIYSELIVCLSQLSQSDHRTLMSFEKPIAKLAGAPQWHSFGRSRPDKTHRSCPNISSVIARSE